MKNSWFIIITGLAGALAGVATFLLTGMVINHLAVQVVTGGLAAVVVPIIIMLLYYPKLISQDPKDQS